MSDRTFDKRVDDPSSEQMRQLWEGAFDGENFLHETGDLDDIVLQLIQRYRLVVHPSITGWVAGRFQPPGHEEKCLSYDRDTVAFADTLHRAVLWAALLILGKNRGTTVLPNVGERSCLR